MIIHIYFDIRTHTIFIGWRIVDERVIQLNYNTIKNGKSFYSFKAWLTILNSSIGSTYINIGNEMVLILLMKKVTKNGEALSIETEISWCQK